MPTEGSLKLWEATAPKPPGRAISGRIFKIFIQYVFVNSCKLVQ